MTTEELYEKYGDEEVMVIDSGLCEGMARWTPRAEFNLPEQALQMKPRYLVENDESYRQVVAYVIIRDMYGDYRVTMRKGGDPRLVGNFACVGGHMDAKDGSLSETALREVTEECNLSPWALGHPIITHLGWIVCNETPVDRVHIGCVFEMQIDDSFSVHETEKLVAVPITAEELKDPATYARCETWLKILLDEGVITDRITSQQVAYRMLMTYMRKNADYGNSFFRSQEMFGRDSVFVRLYDKLWRYQRLDEGREAQVADESMLDTLMDLANYTVMFAMLYTTEQSQKFLAEQPESKGRAQAPIDMHSAFTTSALYSLAINGTGLETAYNASHDVLDAFDAIRAIPDDVIDFRYKALILAANRLIATIVWKMNGSKEADAA